MEISKWQCFSSFWTFSQPRLIELISGHKFRVPTQGILKQLENSIVCLWAKFLIHRWRVDIYRGIVFIFFHCTIAQNTHEMGSFILFTLEILGHPYDVYTISYEGHAYFASMECHAFLFWRRPFSFFVSTCLILFIIHSPLALPNSVSYHRRPKSD